MSGYRTMSSSKSHHCCLSLINHLLRITASRSHIVRVPRVCVQRPRNARSNFGDNFALVPGAVLIILQIASRGKRSCSPVLGHSAPKLHCRGHEVAQSLSHGQARDAVLLGLGRFAPKLHRVISSYPQSESQERWPRGHESKS